MINDKQINVTIHDEGNISLFIVINKRINMMFTVFCERGRILINMVVFYEEISVTTKNVYRMQTSFFMAEKMATVLE